MAPKVPSTITFLGLLVALSLQAQVPTRPGAPGSADTPMNPVTVGLPDDPTARAMAGMGAELEVQVVGEDRALLPRQALIKLRSDTDGRENWNTTQERSGAFFQGLVPGGYSLEVSAAGYYTAVEHHYVQSSFAVSRITIILRQDPSAVDLGPPPGSVIPPGVRKDAERGFVDLKSGKLKDAEKRLTKAHRRAPDSADLNYLLGVLYLQKKDLSQAQTYLAKAIAIDSRHVRALTTLGGLELQQKDYAGAVKMLQQAVAADSQFWTAHFLLARGYLQLAEFEKARQHAELAIQTAKGAANAAQLPLGDALANLGRFPEAIAALETFLRDVPGSPAAPGVRDAIARLKAAAAVPAAAPAKVTPMVEIAPITPEPRLILPNWGPPGIDESPPRVAGGVSCPTQQVLDGAKQRVMELVRDLSRFEAREEVVHEYLDELGKPVGREARKFSYVAAFSRPHPGVPVIEEFRETLSGAAGFPGEIATRGLAGLVFVFHPDQRDSFVFTCEGLGDWQGKAAWLIHFRQREDRPSRLQAYILGSQFYPVDLKGRAWIAASSFHTVHMEAELVRPLPRLQLLTQHQIVDYGRVNFSRKKTALWLPKSAELYFHFRGRRHHRRHTFDHFRLFSVDATDKVSAPTPAQ